MFTTVSESLVFAIVDSLLSELSELSELFSSSNIISNSNSSSVSISTSSILLLLLLLFKEIGEPKILEHVNIDNTL